MLFIQITRQVECPKSQKPFSIELASYSRRGGNWLTKEMPFHTWHHWKTTWINRIRGSHSCCAHVLHTGGALKELMRAIPEDLNWLADLQIPSDQPATLKKIKYLVYPSLSWRPLVLCGWKGSLARRVLHPSCCLLLALLHAFHLEKNTIYLFILVIHKMNFISQSVIRERKMLSFILNHVQYYLSNQPFNYPTTTIIYCYFF